MTDDPLARAARPASPPRSRARWSIRAIMAAIVVVACFLAIARLQPFIGTMLAVYAAGFAVVAARGKKAGSIAVSLAIGVSTGGLLIGTWFFVRDFSMLAARPHRRC